MKLAALIIGLTLLLPTMSAAELPALVVPEGVDRGAVLACVMVADDGSVADAFLLRSSGNAQLDRSMLANIKQLHWDKRKPQDKPRNIWLPMAFAFGGAKPPDLPSHCDPSDQRT